MWGLWAELPLPRVRSLEREFIKRVAEANSPEAVRQIYAKWQGKFKANSSQI
ncbi:hypothetical protein JQ676_001453 [Campylobacter upsaliensis]|nr:hypothetical protein [Campylobacter upsaliensis]